MTGADADDERFELQLIRSATVKLFIGDSVLLIDPYLAGQHEGVSYGGLTRSPLVPLPMPAHHVLADVDVVFVSHLHSDHFDPTAEALLPRDRPIVCPSVLVRPLSDRGFTTVIALADGLRIGPAELRLAPGRHGPDEVLADMGDVHGLIVRHQAGPCLYWVGDSIRCAEVTDTIAREQPTVIAVHACGATWRGIGPLVMDAEQVEAVLRDDTPATVIATHLDSVDHATVSRADLWEYFAGRPELASRLVVPADGDIVDLAVDVR